MILHPFPDAKAPPSKLIWTGSSVDAIIAVPNEAMSQRVPVGEQYSAFHQQLLELLHDPSFRQLNHEEKRTELISFSARQLGIDRSVALCVADAVALVNVQSDALLDRERLEFLSRHDDVSGLPNQEALRQHLTALESSPDADQAATVVWVDIDRFKAVTDALGSEQTNHLISTLSSRLQSVADRPQEMTARLSKDEFALVLIHPSGEVNEAVQRIDRLKQLLCRPIKLDNRRIVLTASLGVSLQNEQDIVLLLNEAEAAMLEAKSLGGNQAVYFTKALQDQREQRLLLESELVRAIEQRELVLHYQPIYNADGTLESAEALVRWNHPDRGLLAPAEFLPMATRAGIITDIDFYVVDQVCRDIAAMKAQGLNTQRIAINLSGQQLNDSDYPIQLHDLLTKHGISGSDIEIEVIEEATKGDTFAVATNLQRLAEMGIRLSIDDFGTGYSSLARLKYLPFHKLKIDRSFVSDLPNDNDVCSMVQAIMGLAGGLSLQLVSEGVETDEQREWLANRDCDYLQGFLMSKPVPLTEYTDLLANGGKPQEDQAPGQSA
ncbi:MAG: bifunctional diguanylate cyclase/phosphodiesterase [Natronospirillum sp.]|uniref:putative bifunctional diguanylate cyclase/phosphodiesterase n=1 Tax=Natronospirillum sp. TaxID=2812955 RepID=UPI0025D62F1A|nr:bifunctional diguanylate cyclase/phosphodiesterase [Natronospirillum sp.]MCH8552404.1 bifunctional diguanylate cyclase/phosphodiesterase [Natronospirillum sp.]